MHEIELVLYPKKKMIELSSFCILFQIVDAHKSKIWEFIYIFSIGWLSCIGGLAFGFETGMLSVSSKDMETYYEISKDLLTYIGTGAIFLGALAAIWGTHVIGRRKMMIINSVLTFIGGVCGLLDVKWIFLMGRLTFGVGLGISYVTCPVFVAELLPEKYRGAMSAFYNLSMSVGQAVPALLSTYFEQVDVPFPWRFLLRFSSILPFVQLFIVILLPESPEWDSKQAKENFFKNIWSLKFFKCVLVSFLLNCIEMCLGQHFVSFYSPKFLNDQPRSVTFGHSLLTSFLGFFGNFLTVFFIDSLGRGMIFNISLFSATASLFLLGLFVNSKSWKVLLVISFYLYTTCSSSFYPLPSLISVEIYPMKYRTLGCSFVGVLKWISNMVISFSLEWTTSALSARGILFICCFLTLTFTVTMDILGLPDSSNIPLEIKNIILKGIEKIKGKYAELFL